jgi:hypothetical protein
MICWHERPPTKEQIAAHATQQPLPGITPTAGLWMVRMDGQPPYLVAFRSVPEGAQYVIIGSHEWHTAPNAPDDVKHPTGVWWRPLTATGDDCSWPVTPTGD